MLLRDKVCIVTGVSSLRGIGFATAALFAEHGATIVAVNLAMNDAVAATVANAIAERTDTPPNLLTLACDITSRDDCTRAVAQVVEQFGRVDCLVHCAGVVGAKATLDVTPDDLERMISVNLMGTFNMCQSVLPQFVAQGGGSIVTIASVAAQRGGGSVGGGHYAASKGGVISFTRTIAREFGLHGVRANVVCPSMTETGMLDGRVSADEIATIARDIPLRRVGRATDVAGACLFLASDLAAYVTGATLDVNGGSHIH